MTDFSRGHIGKPMATAYSEYSRDANGKAVQSNEIISVATIQSVLAGAFSDNSAPVVIRMRSNWLFCCGPVL